MLLYSNLKSHKVALHGYFSGSRGSREMSPMSNALVTVKDWGPPAFPAVHHDLVSEKNMSSYACIITNL